MKHLITLFILCFSLTAFAQDSTNETVSRVLHKLNFGQTASFNNIEIKFVSVISDSRCPVSVNCIRAGEAEVLVDVFKNGEFLKQQKLTFYPSAVNKKVTSLFVSETLNISGLNLMPYPIGPEKIDKKSYFLEVIIEK